MMPSAFQNLALSREDCQSPSVSESSSSFSTHETSSFSGKSETSSLAETDALQTHAIPSAQISEFSLLQSNVLQSDGFMESHNADWKSQQNLGQYMCQVMFSTDGTLRPVEQMRGSRKPLLQSSETAGCSILRQYTAHVKSISPIRIKDGHSASVNYRFPSTPLHGYLRFVEQGSSPSYTFFVNDSEEVFFARACKPDQRSDKVNCDWIYTFHSRKDEGRLKGTWKGWGKKEKLASDVVGKMSVRNIQGSHCTSANTQPAVETHFLLFKDRDQHSRKSSGGDIPHQSASYSLQPVVKVTMPSLLSTAGLPGSNLYQRAKPNSLMYVAGLSQGNINPGFVLNQEKLKHRPHISTHVQDARHQRVEQGETSASHVELAAIVIAASIKEERKKGRYPSKKETAGWSKEVLEKGSSGGWGHKFLGKNSINQSDAVVQVNGVHGLTGLCKNRQNEILQDDGKCREGEGEDQQLWATASTDEPCFTTRSKNSVNSHDATLSGNKKDAKVNVDVTVILPAGDHGFPRNASHGPTSLVKRWRSGGTCDCGNWDVGCGLSVLRTETLEVNGKGENVALTSHDRINWISRRKTLKIFTQGSRRKKILGLERIEAGLFLVSFQTLFSPLQAFATVVAILHQQVTQR